MHKLVLQIRKKSKQLQKEIIKNSGRHLKNSDIKKETIYGEILLIKNILRKLQYINYYSEYGLSTKECVLLCCLGDALFRES